MNPFYRYALIYGGLASAVIAAFLVVTGTLNHTIEWVASEAFGYSAMLVAMSFVFVGVKRYRDIECGGVIKFWRALGLALLIALIASLAYTLIWEAYVAATGDHFIDGWVAKQLAKARASGLSAEKIAKMAADLNALKAAYANPLTRMAMTFGVEIAPVGLVVALASAGLLRDPRIFPAKANAERLSQLRKARAAAKQARAGSDPA